MKLVKVLPMLAVASFCLMGCASKCDYAKFHEKATAVKEHSFKKATVKVDGSSSLIGISVAVKGDAYFIYNGGWEQDKSKDVEAAVLTAASLYIAQRAALVDESDSLEYYAGTTFKVVDKDTKATTEFNGFGLLTSYKSDSMKVSISYSK